MGQRDYSIRAWLDPQKLAAPQHDRRRRGQRDPQAERRGRRRAGRPGRPCAAARRFQLPHRHARPAHATRSSSATSSSRSRPSRRPTGDGGGGVAARACPARIADPLLATARPSTTAASSPRTTNGRRTHGQRTTHDRPHRSPRTCVARGRRRRPGSGAATAATLTTRRRDAAAAPRPPAARRPAARPPRGRRRPCPPVAQQPDGRRRQHRDDHRRARRHHAGPRPGPPTTAIVRLRDVARVELGALNYNQACHFDGKPSVGLTVYQLPGTNALDVADRVRAKMKELKHTLPRRRGLHDRLRHHAVHPRVDRRGVPDPARRGPPGRPRRAVLPAGLAGHDPADDRRARVAHRHLRRHGRCWASA